MKNLLPFLRKLVETPVETTSALERAERFERFVPKTDDLTMMILKGHLLIEELVNEFIAGFPLQPQFMTGARFTFSQKLVIVRSFSLCGDSPLWRCVDALSKLRNKIAHKIEIEDLEPSVDEFNNLVATRFKELRKNHSQSRARRLAAAICFTGGSLSMLIDDMLALKKMVLDGIDDQSISAT